jgi:hypothetical protein
MGSGGGGWINVGVLTRQRPSHMVVDLDLQERRNRGPPRPPMQARWKNTDVLGLGFNPNRHKRRK